MAALTTPREIAKSTFSGTLRLITVRAQAQHTWRSYRIRLFARSPTRICPTILASVRLRRRSVPRSRRRRGHSEPFHDAQRVMAANRHHSFSIFDSSKRGSKHPLSWFLFLCSAARLFCVLVSVGALSLPKGNDRPAPIAFRQVAS